MAVLIGSITVTSYFGEDGELRYTVNTEGELKVDQALGLLELAKVEVIKRGQED